MLIICHNSTITGVDSKRQITKHQITKRLITKHQLLQNVNLQNIKLQNVTSTKCKLLKNVKTSK